MPTRYVNAASVGGDGTTNGLSGSTAAYASLSAALTAEASTSGDLIIYCEGATEDTTAVTISGMSYTTLLIEGDGSYTHNTTDYIDNLKIAQGNIEIKNIVEEKSGSGSKVTWGISVSGISSGYVRLSACTVKHSGTWTLDSGQGMIKISGCTGGTIEINSCYWVDAVQDGIEYASEGGETVYIIGNTVIGATRNGIYTWAANSSATAVDLSNNLVQGSGTADYDIGHAATSDTQNTNISSDTTSPNASLRSIAITFDTAPALASGDTDAHDAGTDKTSITSYDSDFFGVARSTPPDIGAAEYSAGGGSSIAAIMMHRKMLGFG